MNNLFGLDALRNYGYTWDEGNAQQLKESILNQTNKRLVLERLAEHTTQAVIREDSAAGYETSIYVVEKLTGEDYERYIKLGVCEFVEDYHCSMGLNW